MKKVSSGITARGRACALIGGGAGLLTALTVRFVSGSPLAMIHRLGAGDILPPVWFLGLVWLFMPLQCGLSAGRLLSELGGGAEREAQYWRGCTALVLSLMCAGAWYALLFGKGSLLVSGLFLPAAACLSVLAAFAWRRLSVGAVIVVGGNALWYVILFLFQTVAVLRV